VILLRALRSSRWLLAPAALLFLVAACAEAPTAPSAYAPFSSTDLLVGTGTTAATGNTVTVHYTGWLYDAAKPDHKGLQFDSSIGGNPFMFVLGAGQVIQGWDQGVPGMNVGGLRRLVIPSSLAYGEFRSSVIPPYATLVFDIELLEVQ
jgi:FKBP-type peptidyl-prolyl cis-trans isomerase FkpA